MSTKTGPKEKTGLPDLECRQVETLAYNSQCAAHGQPLVACANDRLKQVKQAREMESRTMASARAWQQQANEAREELNRIQADRNSACTR